MMNQNEQGGKDMLLKVAAEDKSSFAAANTGDLITIVGHGLKVGDLFQVDTIVSGAGGLTVNQVYWVLTVPSADTFTLSATRGGSTLAISSDGTGTGWLYKTVGGLRAKTMTLNAEAIDITNHDSDEWKTILDAAGIRSVELSGSGVFENGAVVNAIKTAMMTNALRKAALIDSRAGDLFAGCYKFTSMELGGEYNAEGTYSISMSSSGEIIFQAAS